MCASKTEEAKNLIITSTVQGREIVITGLTGTRYPECGEQYVDAESEIDSALGKKENVDIWLEGDKIVAEIY